MSGSLNHPPIGFWCDSLLLIFSAQSLHWQALANETRATALNLQKNIQPAANLGHCGPGNWYGLGIVLLHCWSDLGILQLVQCAPRGDAHGQEGDEAAEECCLVVTKKARVFWQKPGITCIICLQRRQGEAQAPRWLCV